VVELLELFELVGFESFERSKNFLDGGMPRLCGVMLPILKGQVADRQLLVSTDAQLPAVQSPPIAMPCAR
jgi:hypothetical protein